MLMLLSWEEDYRMLEVFMSLVKQTRWVWYAFLLGYSLASAV
jgi:hypothetical protein